MTPLPKRKLSTRRQGDRRSSFTLPLHTIFFCENCHSPKLPHIACLKCGFYKGRQIRKAKTTKPHVHSHSS